MDENNSDARVIYKLRYKPRESKVKIFNEPIKQPKIESKLNTFEKINYIPQGGSVVIESKPLKWIAQPKLSTFDNIKYKPGGGDVKIETFKLNWEAKSRVSQLLENDHKEIFSPRNNQVKIINEKLDWNNVKPKVNTLEKLSYTPTDDAGHTITYAVEPPPINLNVKSKISHLFENSKYRPPISKVKILDEKLKWEGEPKVNTFEKVNYKPKIGSFKVVTQKIDFTKNAKSKLDTGLDIVVVKKSKDLNRSQNLSSEMSYNDTIESPYQSKSDENEKSNSKAWELKDNKLIFHDINENEFSEYSNSMGTTHDLSNLSKEFLKNKEETISLSDKDR